MHLPNSKGTTVFGKFTERALTRTVCAPHRSPFFVNWGRDFANFLPDDVRSIYQKANKLLSKFVSEEMLFIRTEK